MNIDSNIKRKSRQKSRWLIFAVYTILVLSVEKLYRDPLFDLSIRVIESVQGEKAEESLLIRVSEFISLLGNSNAFLPILFLVYNYANIYKTFILMLTLFISIMQISILKMIYVSPRPYFESEKIKPFGCEGGWGNPSGHSLCSTAFYLALWFIVTDCKAFRNNKIFKNIYLAASCILVLLIMFSRVAVGAHSLNQILFGCLLGLGTYFFLFFVLCIRPNDHQQFAKIFEIRNALYFIVNFIIFVFAFLLFQFNHNEEIQTKYNTVITAKCPDTPLHKRLQNEGLVTLALALANLGAFIGVKFEFIFSFNENVENWAQYNFEIDERDDESSLMTKITINRETQWNHTNFFFSIFRLIVVTILIAIIFFPYYFIKWDDNLVVVLFFKLLIPANVVTFSLFFLFKIILRSLRVVNVTLYSIMNDNL